MPNITANLNTTSPTITPSTYPTTRGATPSLQVIIPSGWAAPIISFTPTSGLSSASDGVSGNQYNYTLTVASNASLGDYTIKVSSSDGSHPSTERSTSGTIDVQSGWDERGPKGRR